MRVCIDSDRTGADLKHKITDFLSGNGFNVTDLGPLRPREWEYAEIGFDLASRIKRQEFDRGILLCGTGNGVAMIANKVRGVFAGTCHDIAAAQHLASHNNAQILAIASDSTSTLLARRMARAFLETEFLPRPNAELMRKLEAQG